MFTGLIEGTGTVRQIKRERGLIELTISKGESINRLKTGDSISVDGVCLTVVRENKDEFTVQVSGESLSRSTLGMLVKGDRVNLELPVRAGAHFGGHIVQGHVDCRGRILRIIKMRRELRIEISIPVEWSKFVVEKGSIAIDGISLTVASLSRNRIEVVIIPHTMKSTNILSKSTGSYVNIEFDILGKYVYNYMNNVTGTKREKVVDLNLLETRGFLQRNL